MYYLGSYNASAEEFSSQHCDSCAPSHDALPLGHCPTPELCGSRAPVSQDALLKDTDLIQSYVVPGLLCLGSPFTGTLSHLRAV